MEERVVDLLREVVPAHRVLKDDEELVRAARQLEAGVVPHVAGDLEGAEAAAAEKEDFFFVQGSWV